MGSAPQQELQLTISMPAQRVCAFGLQPCCDACCAELACLIGILVSRRSYRWWDVSHWPLLCGLCGHCTPQPHSLHGSQMGFAKGTGCAHMCDRAPHVAEADQNSTAVLVLVVCCPSICDCGTLPLAAVQVLLACRRHHCQD